MLSWNNGNKWAETALELEENIATMMKGRSHRDWTLSPNQTEKTGSKACRLVGIQIAEKTEEEKVYEKMGEWKEESLS